MAIKSQLILAAAYFWWTSYQLAPLLILVGNAGAKFLDKEQVKNYYIEARELCKIYNNPLMLMKVENYLKELDTV